MYCLKCEHEFCWDCLGHYKDYVHIDENQCTLSKMLKISLITFLVLTLYVKLHFMFPIIGQSLYWLICFVFINCSTALITIWTIGFLQAPLLKGQSTEKLVLKWLAFLVFLWATIWLFSRINFLDNGLLILSVEIMVLLTPPTLFVILTFGLIDLCIGLSLKLFLILILS
jgi:hypothetical protein